MSDDTLRTAIKKVLVDNGVDIDGGSFHSWRCFDKERYPEPCTCTDEVVEEILTVIAEDTVLNRDQSLVPDPNYPSYQRAIDGCPCRQCNADRGVEVWWMVVCADCGNKRCPHATDHRHACTNSNAPGQSGSVY